MCDRNERFKNSHSTSLESVWKLPWVRFGVGPGLAFLLKLSGSWWATTAACGVCREGRDALCELPPL